MTIPDDIREAVLRVLEHAMEDESERYDETAPEQRPGHVYESLCLLQEWLGPVRVADIEYTIGINNDDGGCYDIAILREGEPIATLIAPEAEVHPLVHAGNCFHKLVDALQEMLRCFSGDGMAPLKERDAARRTALNVVAKATGGGNG